MTESCEYLEWDDKVKTFLKEWFSALLEGIERLNGETWPKILEMTGRACAHVHTCESFKNLWDRTKNIDDFILEINETKSDEIYKKLDNNTLSVSYSRCKCPLVRLGLVDSPLLCYCSPNWLMENFETIFEKSVTVATKQTILRGAKSCYFTISFET